jgi:hypothetical protein
MTPDLPAASPADTDRRHPTEGGAVLGYLSPRDRPPWAILRSRLGEG